MDQEAAYTNGLAGNSEIWTGKQLRHIDGQRSNSDKWPGSNSDKWMRKQLRQIDEQEIQTNGRASNSDMDGEATQTNGPGSNSDKLTSKQFRQMARKQL